MLYKHSSQTGRIAAAGAQIPKTFGPGVAAPEIHYPPGTTFPKEGLARKYGEVPKVLLEKMKHFQIPNNLPVHIRGGPTDKILYGLTAGICAVGLIHCFKVYYDLSFPKKQD
ncbi:cytochrome c oxidase subunit 7A, mitochondrial-like [Oratosquilla oratoria]|uniref:cytochrome c oxidase subunit 7A, mitochondrial-like n=1 Tax=Oratosquilla oratoria TaxID=337810 RepID=UPI003F765465